MVHHLRACLPGVKNMIIDCIIAYQDWNNILLLLKNQFICPGGSNGNIDIGSLNVIRFERTRYSLKIGKTPNDDDDDNDWSVFLFSSLFSAGKYNKMSMRKWNVSNL